MHVLQFVSVSFEGKKDISTQPNSFLLEKINLPHSYLQQLLLAQQPREDPASDPFLLCPSLSVLIFELINRFISSEFLLMGDKL